MQLRDHAQYFSGGVRGQNTENLLKRRFLFLVITRRREGGDDDAEEEDRARW